MEEIINTKSQNDTSLPDGEREWRVEEVRRLEKGKNVLYIWKLSFEGEGEREIGEQLLLPGMMGDLLRILGFEEISHNKFKWDRELAVGKYFISTVSHDPDRKKSDVIRQNMTAFKKSDKNSDDIPF